MGPTEDFEREARRCGYRRVAGIDEAGRGPLAGPVVAAAVILPNRCRINGLNDSKQLTETQREELWTAIAGRAVAIGIGSADAREIDALNILEATRLAMYRAVAGLAAPADFLLIDAVSLPEAGLPFRAIVKGDALSCAIAAASIVAKVTRDRLMIGYHDEFPQYNFRSHKGYGTEDHLQRLASHGPCPIHRRTFAPVRAVIETREQAPPVLFR